MAARSLAPLTRDFAHRTGTPIPSQRPDSVSVNTTLSRLRTNSPRHSRVLTDGASLGSASAKAADHAVAELDNCSSQTTISAPSRPTANSSPAASGGTRLMSSAVGPHGGGKFFAPRPRRFDGHWRLMAANAGFLPLRDRRLGAETIHERIRP